MMMVLFLKGVGVSKMKFCRLNGQCFMLLRRA
ncbi:hypothetical protein Godav_010041 [Gossypium davidsonii]|uniref:Uncharacterized protein n=1 Tax=Gossypium davidsonii TaxID=34287 RepID=A0A7J8SGN2_GOSDV|nr:hypothetical protein [Gossypium davidsonii]